MTNPFYTRVFDVTPGNRVASQAIEDEFARVNAGFDAASTALNLKAPLASPSLTGTALLVNQETSGTATFAGVTINGTLDMNAGTPSTITGLATPSGSTDAATKGYVDTQISNLIDAAPGTLDTMNELAAALGDDANFAATTAASIAAKLPLAGGTMSGVLNMGSQKITGLATATAGGDAISKDYVDTLYGSTASAAASALSAAADAGTATTGAGTATTQAGIATTKAGEALTSANNANASAIAAAASAGGLTSVDVQTHAATSKTTPVDADEIPLADSAASFGLKKLTWANLKANIPSGAILSIVTATTQTAVAGYEYVLTNVAVTTVTLPLTPNVGDKVIVKPANGLITNVINPNGSTIEGVSGNMTIDNAYAVVNLQYLNSSWRLV